MGEFGDVFPEEPPVGRMIDGLIKRVGTDADGGPAQVVLADVDRVERRVPGFPTFLQDVALRDGIIVEGEIGHVGLVVDDILLQFELLVLKVGHEEDVVPRIGHLPESGDHLGLVAVSDVVFLAVGQIGPIRLGSQTGLVGVDVGTVLPFRQSEGKDRSLAQQSRSLLPGLGILGHPDGTEAENGDLPGVPVGQAVEGKDLIELAIAPRVPAGGAVPVRGGRQQPGEYLFAFLKIQKIPVPGALVIVLLEPGLALAFEERDRFEHDVPRFGIGIIAIMLPGVQQYHMLLLKGYWMTFVDGVTAEPIRLRRNCIASVRSRSRHVPSPA